MMNSSQLAVDDEAAKQQHTVAFLTNTNDTGSDVNTSANISNTLL